MSNRFNEIYLKLTALYLGFSFAFLEFLSLLLFFWAKNEVNCVVNIYGTASFINANLYFSDVTLFEN